MINIVLAFNLIAVLFAILAGLSLFLAIVGMTLSGSFLPHMTWLITLILLLFFAVSVAIAQGLKHYKRWSYLLGGIEALLFLLMGVFSLVLNEFDVISGHLGWLVIPLALIFGLKKDYARKPVQESPNTQQTI